MLDKELSTHLPFQIPGILSDPVILSDTDQLACFTGRYVSLVEEFVSFCQCQTQTQRLLGSVALKPYANCQFDHLVPIESLAISLVTETVLLGFI